MNDIKDRIKLLLVKEKYSISRLAGGNGTPAQLRMNTQINGDTTLSADTILRILTTFPNVSAEWLMRGEGEMYKTATISNNIRTMTGGTLQSGAKNTIINNTTNEELTRNLLAEKDARIKELESDKQILKSTIELFHSRMMLNDNTL